MSQLFYFVCRLKWWWRICCVSNMYFQIQFILMLLKFLFFCVYVCACVFTCVHMHTRVHTCTGHNSSEEVRGQVRGSTLSFHYVCSGGQTRVCRLGSRCCTYWAISLTFLWMCWLEHINSNVCIRVDIESGEQVLGLQRHWIQSQH